MCHMPNKNVILLHPLRHPAELVAIYMHSQEPVRYRGLLLERSHVVLRPAPVQHRSVGCKPDETAIFCAISVSILAFPAD